MHHEERTRASACEGAFFSASLIKVHLRFEVISRAEKFGETKIRIRVHGVDLPLLLISLSLSLLRRVREKSDVIKKRSPNRKETDRGIKSRALSKVSSLRDLDDELYAAYESCQLSVVSCKSHDGRVPDGIENKAAIW